uniref:Uncharacterized protein n=1 Tax=Arundo donax TaxID=35708 RepID=A0A0A9G0Y4_ARUDO
MLSVRSSANHHRSHPAASRRTSASATRAPRWWRPGPPAACSASASRRTASP